MWNFKCPVCLPHATCRQNFQKVTEVREVWDVYERQTTVIGAVTLRNRLVLLRLRL